MDNLQAGVITLVRAALTGEHYKLPADFDLEQAAHIGRKHGIVTMLYYGMLNCGVDRTLPLIAKLFQTTCKSILVSERQMDEIQRIFAAFDEKGIAYMPLKGTLIKQLYPKPEMRSMGDADILIKTEQYDLIKPVMEALGFTEKLESDHELIWQKPAAYIELHKRLIPSYNKDYYAYFGNGWKLAKCCDGTRYSMTDEDQLIYLFTHFAKHYRDAGIGIRHFVDLWVYRKNKPALDEEYLNQELTKLSLYDFFGNIMDTLAVWFEDRPATDVTDFITAIVFNSGVYGTHEAHILSEAVKKSKSLGSARNVRAHSFFTALFPPYGQMCQKYPFLRKCPVLLPFLWIYRIIISVLFRKNNVKAQQKRINIMRDQNVSGYQDSLHFVGLDFNFKE